MDLRFIPDASARRLRLLKPQASDDVLTALWEQAAGDFLSESGLTDIPEKALPLIEQMTLFRFNQTDAEGLASQGFSGMSESYLTDYPARLQRLMHGFRRVKLR